MIPMIRKRDFLPLIFVIALVIILVKAPAKCYGEPFTIEIDVAPNVLNIQSQGTVVTVHTDIPYSAVAGSSVTLNGIDIYFYKADNRGYFVAKFLMNAVKDLVDEGHLTLGTITLTLEGLTKYNEEFIGIQDVIVVDNVPTGGQ